MSSGTNALPLTPVEHAVIAGHVPLPPGLEARLRFAVHIDSGVEVRLSDADLDALVQALLAVLAETEDMALADVLTGVLARVRPVMPNDVPEEFDRAVFPPELPDEICQEIHTLLRSGQFDSLDDAYDAVQNLLEGHNDRPQDALLGLTPSQGYQLLSGGWNGPESVLRIQEDMTSGDCAQSAYYRRALVMLQMLEEEGGAQLTKQKNLNRKWVRHILEQIVEPEFEYMLATKEFDNLNEPQCAPVHYLRIFLELARFVRIHKGKLLVTKRGRQCLEPSRAGELQSGMFLAMVTKFNLAYFDMAPEYDGVQSTYPFILYALGQVAREPVSEDVARGAVYLPEVADEFEEYQYTSHADYVLRTRILRPLRDFGLLSYGPARRPLAPPPDEVPTVQVTPLFDRMIRFDWAHGKPGRGGSV